jgi:hypothetical protein
MTELTLFASTFVLVFALGLQSLNVNNGHFIAAAVTSFVIGAGQMILFKLAPHASWTEIAAFLVGGPFGITTSMWAHPHLVRILGKKSRIQSPTPDQIANLKRIDQQFPQRTTRGR